MTHPRLRLPCPHAVPLSARPATTAPVALRVFFTPPEQMKLATTRHSHMLCVNAAQPGQMPRPPAPRLLLPSSRSQIHLQGPTFSSPLRDQAQLLQLLLLSMAMLVVSALVAHELPPRPPILLRNHLQSLEPGQQVTATIEASSGRLDRIHRHQSLGVLRKKRGMPKTPATCSRALVSVTTPVMS